MSGIWTTGPDAAGTLARSEAAIGTSEAAKATDPAFEGGDAGTATDALVVDLQRLVQARVLVERRVEERLDEGRPRGVERATRRLQVGGEVRGVARRTACRPARWCRRGGRTRGRGAAGGQERRPGQAHGQHRDNAAPAGAVGVPAGHRWSALRFGWVRADERRWFHRRSRRYRCQLNAK